MTDLAERLARYSYKPGWSIELGEENGKPAIVVKARVPDVNNPQRMTVVRGGRVLRCLDLDDEELQVQVLCSIDVVEAHDRDEWFMCDGVKVNDPHGES